MQQLVKKPQWMCLTAESREERICECDDGVSELLSLRDVKEKE